MKNDASRNTNLPIRAVGFPWFRREDFPRIKAIMEDSQKLHDTWEGWHAAAQEGEKKFKAQGHIVYRAVLLPDEFIAFCKAKGIALDAKARMNFSAFLTHEKYGQTH